jgi:hypothetical protein
MKKKHRKKSKGPPRKSAAHHAAHASSAKQGKHRGPHAKPAPHAKTPSHSSALLRAIKRRRAAEHGEHAEHSATRRPGTKRHNRGHGAAHKHSHHSAEPVVTEKSFENMLAYRRFQNHAR